jgi:hypothetical protein
MKRTFVCVVVTALVTWLAMSVANGLATGRDRLWLVSAVKAPGRMALEDIQKDLDEGRCDLARAKLKAFGDAWRRFDSGPDSFAGPGIGDIMVLMSRIDTNKVPGNSPVSSPHTGN